MSLSLVDPFTLTAEEADALGANLFAPRRRGSYARGTARILFTQPQGITVNQANFFTSKSGMHMLPTTVQSIRSDEMLVNVTADGLYYFDVDVVAESAGAAYKMGPGELISVANVPAATRVTNVSRFEFGEDEESVPDYVLRLQQSLGERSLVTLRGIAAKLLDSFPSITRLNAVGHGDTEMLRDIIKGSGLGPIATSGIDGAIQYDDTWKAQSRRFTAAGADFLSFTDMPRRVQPDVGAQYVLTVFGATAVAAAVDVDVWYVRDAQTLELKEAVLDAGATALSWTLRRKELTLSSIPGGILYPQTSTGTVVIASDEVHVGGMTDTYVRGSGADVRTLVLTNVVADTPAYEGTGAFVGTLSGTSTVAIIVGHLRQANVEGTELERALDAAVAKAHAVELLDGPEAGTYTVVEWGYDVDDDLTEYLYMRVADVLSVSTVQTRWRLLAEIDVDLIDPRERLVSGANLQTVQGSDVVTSAGGVDFNASGVSRGDTVRILTGSVAGEYIIAEDPLSPSALRVTAVMTATVSDLGYEVFTPNPAGGITPPLVRVTKVEMLDAAEQPIGTTIPYAKPIDVQSRAFQNPSRGVKHDLTDTTLGIVSKTDIVFPTASGTLQFHVDGAATPLKTVTIGGCGSLASLVAELNAEIQAAYNTPYAAVDLGGRFGIRPFGAAGFVAVVGGSLLTALFGNSELRTTGDVRSVSITQWTAARPAIDSTTGLDVVQPVGGPNVGFYAGPFMLGITTNDQVAWPGVSGYRTSTALIPGSVKGGDRPTVAFTPEVGRRVLIGARSLGSARVYFMDPTTFEVGPDTRFTLDNGVGPVRFLPDPTMEQQKLPALPTDGVYTNAYTTDMSASVTLSDQQLQTSGIRAGDIIEFLYIALEGTVVLTDPLPVAGKTFVFAYSGEPDRTVIFIRDDVNLPTNMVSRQGLLDQINSVAGEDLATLTGDNRLRLFTGRHITVREPVGFSANALILGNLRVLSTDTGISFSSVDVTNDSPHSGRYTIATVASQTLLTLTTAVQRTALGTWPSGIPYQTWRISRTGVQRISSTQMAENIAEAGLYYFDVELISEGSGDFWNIDSSNQLVPSGYVSEGYYLTTEDSNLSFSELERPRIVLSRTILEPGVDDDPSNATGLSNANLLVTYDASALVANVQSFMSADTERVVCANPLVRHLVPHYVRLDVQYTGGTDEDTVRSDVELHIQALPPVDGLDASDIQHIITQRGATYVKNPLSLLALVHGNDRSVWAARSQDRLFTGRLSAFIPDRISVTRSRT
jgi:hypothetical protein